MSLFSKPSYPEPFVKMAELAPENAVKMHFDQYSKNSKECYLQFLFYRDDKGKRVYLDNRPSAMVVPLKNVEKFGNYVGSNHTILVEDALAYSK